MTTPQPAADCERCAHSVVPGCPDCLPDGSITLDSLSRTAEEILDGVTDEASARDRLARLAAERADWAPHGFVPVPVGWLRHLAAATPADPDGVQHELDDLTAWAHEVCEAAGVDIGEEGWDEKAVATIRALLPVPSAAVRVETVGRVLHDRRHPLGYGHTCDRCRADAEAVAAVLTGETP